MTVALQRVLDAGAFLLALAPGCTRAHPPVPGVVFVQPSGHAIPANLLRVSILFDAPVAEPVLGRLTLRLGDGSSIAEPFLAQELWSRDGRVLTVLLHPGRVKTGLKARDKLGAILAADDEVTLLLDGHPIKRWRTTLDDDSGPMPSAWTLSKVRAGTRQPLVVSLDAPIDGRDGDHLAIADYDNQRVAGRGRLSRGESTWTFTPGAPWRAATYKLVARGTLEDPSGNRLGSRFGTSIDVPPGPPLDAEVPFTAAPP
ncbi:hypothetical protein C7T35_33005 [Variovorax sp. WS11]|uniref:hypothetical protein n=1 Tax=Variovorax sp. WS11 TaxID=1105204 RepID=UPI000D0D6ED0|nr:hypothetical protein [Variovorax sp. WS11]NDZ15904.1 hypothetical protein [Variovorax sp. WS11]PSL80307.1 hypothetical protein C7T35_33005 [Variovorax sp. WS11]